MDMRALYASYDYHRQGHARDARGAVPLGNGRQGANVWVESDGAVYLLLAQTEAMSETGRLLKSGMLRLNLGDAFAARARADFSVYDARLTLTGDGAEVTLYMDANAPRLHISVSCARETPVTLKNVCWRKDARDIRQYDPSAYNLMLAPHRVWESGDTLFETERAIGQYHLNERSEYANGMALQGLGGFMGHDPILNRVSGFMAESAALTPLNNECMTGVSAEFDIDIYFLNEQTDSAEQWLSHITQLSGRAFDGAAHERVWHAFWDEYYVFASGSEQARTLTRGLIYARYMIRCGDRGEYPLKFNGSLFTAEPAFTDAFTEDDHKKYNVVRSAHIVDDERMHRTPKEQLDYDYRLWGVPYWLQNTRLPYWAALLTGDYEAVLRYFAFLKSLLPVCEYRTRAYYNHPGALIPETLLPWGTYPELNYGWDRTDLTLRDVRTPHIKMHFEGQLEAAYMMLRYYGQTRDEEFLETTACPFCLSVLTFFDRHFERLDGKLLLHPVSALETWQICADDLPDIAGLYAVTELSVSYARKDSELCHLAARLRGELPPLPKTQKEGREVYAPARVLIDPGQRNCEVPELYCVFPFGEALTDARDWQTARDTYALRYTNDLTGGWRTDCVWAAALGLRDEAADAVEKHFDDIADGYDFPGFYGPNYDWTPDHCHLGSNVTALVTMLVSAEQDGARVLGGWKKDLDVIFRLPATGGAVTLAYESGAVTRLERTERAAPVRVSV